jgi:hypothetical protein
LEIFEGNFFAMAQMGHLPLQLAEMTIQRTIGSLQINSLNNGQIAEAPPDLLEPWGSQWHFE